ncbi:MAG: hypothetical protein JO101_08190 [Candidatus Eremiobacteraeota bacterium]|nr:hypothetical protein [Candidatus Eremiobacteraeota bacterium]
MTAAAFEVLSLPSLAVDRRTLSQAWYDALHVAQRQSFQSFVATRRAFGAANLSQRAAAPLPAQTRGRRTPASPAGPARAALTARASGAGSALSPRDVRRANRVGQRIAAAVRRDTGRASFTLSTANGRVHVVIEQRGGSLRLIALCAPAARRFVERAMAYARFELAGSGIAVAW